MAAEWMVIIITTMIISSSLKLADRRNRRRRRRRRNQEAGGHFQDPEFLFNNFAQRLYYAIIIITVVRVCVFPHS